MASLHAANVGSRQELEDFVSEGVRDRIDVLIDQGLTQMVDAIQRELVRRRKERAA